MCQSAMTAEGIPRERVQLDDFIEYRRRKDNPGGPISEQAWLMLDHLTLPDAGFAAYCLIYDWLADRGTW